MNNYSIIKSVQNPLVKHIVRLSKRSEREACREFIIEGDKLLYEAVSSSINITEILASEQAAERFDNMLYTLTVNGVKICIASDEVMKKCSQFEQTQGIIAIAKMPETSDLLTGIANKGDCIILQSIQDPGNLGTIIRSAEAMGISGLIISKDTVDIYNLKTLRGSMGSAFRIGIYVSESIPDVIGQMREIGVKVYASALSDESSDIRQVDFSGSVAVVIGNEGKGLSDDAIKACQSSIVIPMAGRTESLNASVAASIIMWEIWRRRQ